MKTIQQKVADYSALAHSAFGFMEKLEFTQQTNANTWDKAFLSLWLRSSTFAGSSVLKLNFAKVQDLRLGNIEGLLRYCIEIRLIQDNGLEEVRLRVTETEYNLLAFYCCDFDFLVE